MCPGILAPVVPITRGTDIVSPEVLATNPSPPTYQAPPAPPYAYPLPPYQGGYTVYHRGGYTPPPPRQPTTSHRSNNTGTLAVVEATKSDVALGTARTCSSAPLQPCHHLFHPHQ